MQRHVYEEYGGVNPAFNSHPDLIRAKESKNQVYAKIFGWFGLGLLVTALTSFGIAFLMAYYLGQADYSAAANEAAYRAFIIYLSVLLGSFVFMLILSFIINWRIAKGGAKLLVPFLLYSMLMGVFISAFLVAGVPFYVMGEAFGVTALVFLSMGLIGYFSKKNLNWLLMILGGLLVTMMISGIFFWLMFLFLPGTFSIWSLGISLLFTLFIVIVVAVDMQNVKAAVENGASGRSFELMCAFTFYTSFMQLFIRILYIALLIMGRSRRN